MYSVFSSRFSYIHVTFACRHQVGETPEQNGPPKSFHSRIDERTNEMLLMVYRPLDYEITPEYTLTIKAAVSASTDQSAHGH